MSVNTSTYAIQKVFTIRAFDLVTNECLAELKDLKDSNLSFGGELVYATGGVGNPKIAGFSHSNTAMLTATNALINFGASSLVLGATPIIGSTTKYVYTDVISPAGATPTTANTTYTAIGTAGSEIKFVYIQNSDGTLGTKLTQNGTVSAGKFTYTAGTKTLTFNSGDIPTGSKIVCFYNATLGSSSRTITKTTDLIPKQVKIVADTLVKDTCTGVEYGAQVTIWNAQTSPNMEMALSADGEPAVQGIEFEGLKNCLTNDLATMVVFDSSETV